MEAAQQGLLLHMEQGKTATTSEFSQVGRGAHVYDHKLEEVPMFMITSGVDIHGAPQVLEAAMSTFMLTQLENHIH